MKRRIHARAFRLGAGVAFLTGVGVTLQLVAFEHQSAWAQTTCSVVVPPSTGSTTTGLTALGYLKGIGMVYDSVVIHNRPQGCPDRYYVLYQYNLENLEVVEINPCLNVAPADTYKAFSTLHLPKEQRQGGAMTIAAGDSGNVYIGTNPGARIYWIDKDSQCLHDLGRIDAKPDFQSNGTLTPATETYVNDITSTADLGHYHYAVTYPGAKLYRFMDGTSPSKPTLVGTVDSSQKYARYAVIMKNKLFVGTGKDTPKVFTYSLSTSTGTPFPMPTMDSVNPFLRGDENAYEVATLAKGKFNGELYASYPTSTSSSLVYHQLTSNQDPNLMLNIQPPQLKKTNELSNGQPISVSHEDRRVNVGAANGNMAYYKDYFYAGNRLGIHGFVLADGKIYGTSALPCRFFSIDPAAPSNSSTTEIQAIGKLLGAGQMYTGVSVEFTEQPKHLVFGTYSTDSRLYTTPLGSTPMAPTALTLPTTPAIKPTWRPWTITQYPLQAENKIWVYTGSPHDEKGRHGGFIAAVKLRLSDTNGQTSPIVEELKLFHTVKNNANAFDPFTTNMENHSITGILVDRNSSSLYGGSGLQGNDASSPLTGPAKLFRVQLNVNGSFGSTTVIGLPLSTAAGASTTPKWYPTVPFGGIQNLIMYGGKLWGVLDQARLVVVDSPANLSGISTQSLDATLEDKPNVLVRNSSYGGVLNNTIVQHNGSLWLTTRKGILQIKTQRSASGLYPITLHPLEKDGSPIQPTGGGGISIKDGVGVLYLSAGADLIAYKLPN